MDRQQVGRAIVPLRLVFWGGLIELIDFTIGTEPVKFDLLSDAIGMTLIAIGFCRLAAIKVSQRYLSAMRFVALVSIGAAVGALASQFVSTPASLELPVALWGILELAAIIVFCSAMLWMCEAAGLDRSRRSWKTTRGLFIVLHVIPVALLQLDPESVRDAMLEVGPNSGVILFFVGVLLIPVIHLFVSTSRMAREARRAESEAPLPEPTPQA